MWLTRILSLVVLTSMLACSTSSVQLKEEPELAKRGLKAFGKGVPYMVVRIPDAVEKNPLRQEKLDKVVIDRLSSLFSKGANETVHLVIGGPSSPRTRAISILALQQTKSVSLGGLVMVFAGDKQDAMKVRKVASDKLATVY